MSVFSDLENLNKEEAARKLYYELKEVRTWDTALPQDWVDRMRDEHDFDVRPHFVWLYTDGDAFGCPAPVSFQGLLFMSRWGLMV